MERKKVLIGVILVIGIAAFIYHLSGESYPYKKKVGGVKIQSKIPFQELENRERTAVFKTKDKSAVTCNFEISAISTSDKKGYQVHIEQGQQGVYLYQDSAYLKGQGKKVLDSCHAFSCLFTGLECPENFSKVRKVFSQQRNLTLVLDRKIGNKGVEAYTELLGVMGYLQAEWADLNKDGVVSHTEKEKNDLYIHPYLKNGSACSPQKFSNLYQKNFSLEKKECQNIESGIFLLNSPQPRIEVQGKKIILYGNKSKIYQEAVIVRDILSPKWIRVIYNMS